MHKGCSDLINIFNLPFCLAAQFFQFQDTRHLFDPLSWSWSVLPCYNSCILVLHVIQMNQFFCSVQLIGLLQKKYAEYITWHGPCNLKTRQLWLHLELKSSSPGRRPCVWSSKLAHSTSCLKLLPIFIPVKSNCTSTAKLPYLLYWEWEWSAQPHIIGCFYSCLCVVKCAG